MENYIIAICDCGTTNTKCYIVEKTGKFISEKYGSFGCNQNITSSKMDLYIQQLRKLVEEAIAGGGHDYNKLKTVVAFGMISSDLGIQVIPHLTVPVSVEDLQAGLFEVADKHIFGKEIQFLLLRGVRNTLAAPRSIANLDICDFMRGEETQVVGIIQAFPNAVPYNVITLGTHAKIIHVDSNRRIVQSMTTMSGQLFDCLCHSTIVGKSIKPLTNEINTPSFTLLVETAKNMLDKYGSMRALLLPRFMEAFTSFGVEERRLFLEAVIAFEDLHAMHQYHNEGEFSTDKYFILGQSIRCKVMAEALKLLNPSAAITFLEGKEKNRDISIMGAMKLIEYKVN